VGAYFFMDYLEEHSNGRISFERYPGGQLGNLPEQLNLVSSNSVDMATLIHVIHPQALPLNACMPGNFLGSAREAIEYPNSLELDTPGISELLEQEWADNNLKFFTFTTSGVFGIISREPINSIDDMKGMKIGLVSQMKASAWSNLGAVPTVLESADMYEAITRGQVDCIELALSAHDSLKLYENADYIYVTNVYASSAPILFNLKTWNALPEDIKDLFYEAAEYTKEAMMGVEQGTLSQDYLDTMFSTFVEAWEADAMANGELLGKKDELAKIWEVSKADLGW